MVWPYDVRRAIEVVADEYTAATDYDNRNRTSGGFHLFNGLGEGALHLVDCRQDQFGVEVSYQAGIADVCLSVCHCDVGGGELRAAEHQGPGVQLVSGAVWSDGEICSLFSDEAATTES